MKAQTPRQQLIEMAASKLRMQPAGLTDPIIQAAIEGVLETHETVRDYYTWTSYRAQSMLIHAVRIRAARMRRVPPVVTPEAVAADMVEVARNYPRPVVRPVPYAQSYDVEIIGRDPETGESILRAEPWCEDCRGVCTGACIWPAAPAPYDPADLNKPICAMFGCTGHPDAICGECGGRVCERHQYGAPCTACATKPTETHAATRTRPEPVKVEAPLLPPPGDDGNDDMSPPPPDYKTIFVPRETTGRGVTLTATLFPVRCEDGSIYAKIETTATWPDGRPKHRLRADESLRLDQMVAGAYSEFQVAMIKSGWARHTNSRGRWYAPGTRPASIANMVVMPADWMAQLNTGYRQDQTITIPKHLAGRDDIATLVAELRRLIDQDRVAFD